MCQHLVYCTLYIMRNIDDMAQNVLAWLGMSLVVYSLAQDGHTPRSATASECYICVTLATLFIWDSVTFVSHALSLANSVDVTLVRRGKESTACIAF
jgi:hypothetical protein